MAGSSGITPIWFCLNFIENNRILNYAAEKSNRQSFCESCVACAMVLCMLPAEASAGSFMDYIRNYDLNDYSFGVAISGSQSPYLGADSSTFGYPFLTSFRDSAFTDDWLVVRDGDLGVRWVSNSGWELGVVGRIQTQGTGSSDAPQLTGIEDRKWALEMGPIIGWRGWPVHINFKAYTEITDRHEGLTSEIRFSLPQEWDRGYLVPSIDLIHRDADYTNYYYGVTPAEALPGRPAYTAGDSLNTALSVRWGYEISEKWLLSGSVGLEMLDDAITDSPIVGRDEIWSVNIGLAYNADIFEPRESQRSGGQQPRFEIRVGAFNSSIDSKIVRESSAGDPGSEVDLEQLLGLEDNTTVMQFDTIIRIGNFHRFEIGYFEMSRSGLGTLTEDLAFGNETFVTATEVASSFESKLLRFSYAYSLMNDDQKELGVMAGLHYAQFKTFIEAPDTGQREFSNASTPLPVVGLHGSVRLGQKMVLGARIQAFRMHFDRYEGTLNYATLDLQRQFGEKFSLGLGYNYYGFNLENRDNESAGKLEIRHHGPVLFASMGF
jgi:outer membrane scaffolding protein for murein synthesis (MipA/OmpV family)